MIFSIYGVSRSGKDFLIQKLKECFESKGTPLLHINGSSTLNEIAESRYGRSFKLLSHEEKNLVRVKFVEYVRQTEQEAPYIVVDGHYAFYDESGGLFKVFTQQDLQCYDKFFYLDTEPEFIVSRMRTSEGDKKNISMTAEEIRIWQNYEIECMMRDLIADDKELHIVKFDSDFCLSYIYDAVTTDCYDSKVIASKMLEGVEIVHETVILTDCDKTLSVEDSTDIALGHIGASKTPLKQIYRDDRYSNYQMLLAHRYYDEVSVFTPETVQVVADSITLNRAIIEDLNSKTNATVLAITAGNTAVWEAIVRRCGLNATILQNTGLTSKYVKYYVAKLLRARGKFVVALGDSLLDSLMLTEANIGYLSTAKGYRASIETFVKENPSVRQLSYFPYQYDGIIAEDSILSIKTLPLAVGTQALVDVCKSDSGVTGKRLREAHRKLGVLVAKEIRKDYPDKKFAVVIMMRSGLPFGEGIADELDAPVLFYDDRNKSALGEQIAENPQLQEYRMILCDGVVNTGKSILELASEYIAFDPMIATNVISQKFDSSVMIPIYASRISKNSYVGAKQKTVQNGKGPDTSDRLFNLI